LPGPPADFRLRPRALRRPTWRSLAEAAGCRDPPELLIESIRRSRPTGRESLGIRSLGAAHRRRPRIGRSAGLCSFPILGRPPPRRVDPRVADLGGRAARPGFRAGHAGGWCATSGRLSRPGGAVPPRPPTPAAVALGPGLLIGGRGGVRSCPGEHAVAGQRGPPWSRGKAALSCKFGEVHCAASSSVPDLFSYGLRGR
jgi:hypothetical protein